MDATCTACMMAPRRPCVECDELLGGCDRHGAWLDVFTSDPVPLPDCVLCDRCHAGQQILYDVVTEGLTPETDPARWADLRAQSAHYRAALRRREQQA